MASDASNKGSCAYGVKGLDGLFMQRTFTTEESEYSSGHQELLAVLHTLIYKEAVLRQMSEKRRNILWLTDSQNMVTFLTKGSTKLAIQKVILDIFRRAQKLSIRIQLVHVSRNDFRIQLADEGTRFFNPDDWSVDGKSFGRISRGKQVTLDLFAHTTNAKADVFFSYGKCAGSS